MSALKELGIEWKGRPKSFRDIETPDVVVTMGCEVQCPYIPGARMIQWEIPDPKGGSEEEYLEAAGLVKRKLIRLIEDGIGGLK